MILLINTFLQNTILNLNQTIMSNSNQVKVKKRRIIKGTLVASSNTIKYSCIKVLDIAHYYNPLNYNRVKQVVINT